MDKLKGKKIVNIYHDSAYGKETIPVLDAQAKKYGFEVTHIAVPHPGNEQQAQWLQVRQIKPDWVILRGWGVMNPVALKAAAKIGFPRDKIVGVWWSGAEEDVIPAGDAAKGYIAAAFNVAGTNYPVVQEIQKRIYAKGKGEMDDKSRIGSIYYNRGVVHGIITVEAIRKAQEKYGKKPLTGEQVRWGLENLNINDARLKELGATGFMQALKVSCADHEGGGAVKFMQWDGKAVEGDHRLDRVGPVDRAPDDRRVRGQVRQGKGHHPARLLEGELILAAERAAAMHVRVPAWREPCQAASPRRLVHRPLPEPEALILMSQPCRCPTSPSRDQGLPVGQQHRGHLRPRHPGAEGRVAARRPQGKIVALLGANGAGKTTTLKAISNLLRAERGDVTKGSIEFDGERIDRLTPAELVRRGVCQVMEGRHCFQHLTVEENLLTGAFSRKVGRAELKADLEKVYTYFPRLKQRRSSQSGYTSGGEQQMTAVGRALMAQPKMILLDEPSMGLAPQIVEEIFEIVKNLNQKEGVSFLLAEQNTMVALRYADYGYILENGRVVMDGVASDLATNEDVKEFYLGLSTGGRKSFRDVKHYRRRKRWLA